MASNVNAKLLDALDNFKVEEVQLYKNKQLEIDDVNYSEAEKKHLSLIEALVLFLKETKYDHKEKIDEMNNRYSDYCKDNKRLGTSDLLCGFLTEECFSSDKGREVYGLFKQLQWSHSFEFFGQRIASSKHVKLALPLLSISLVVTGLAAFYASPPIFICCVVASVLSLVYFMSHQLWLRRDKKFILPLEEKVASCNKEKSELFKIDQNDEQSFENPEKELSESKIP